MKHFFLILTFLLMPATGMAQEAPAKTIVEDEAEAALLLGRHLFTQFGLSYTFAGGAVEFGDAVISNNDGVYTIKADHTCYFRQPRHPKYISGGYVRIQGQITKIEHEKFTIQGTLSSFFKHNFAYKDGSLQKCDVETEIVFSRHKDENNLDLPDGDLPYWSLDNTTHILEVCGEQIRLPIHIYTKQHEGPAPIVDCARTLKDAAHLPME